MFRRQNIILAVLSAVGKSKISFVPTKMNSIIYNDLVEEALLSFIGEKSDEDCKFPHYIFQSTLNHCLMNKVYLCWTGRLAVRTES